LVVVISQSLISRNGGICTWAVAAESAEATEIRGFTEVASLLILVNPELSAELINWVGFVSLADIRL
jgi:hypothetical protein